MPVYRRVNTDFFKQWSPDMAYILGFFAADGYMTVNKRGGQYWCFQITDKKLLEDIKIVIDSDHQISTKIVQGMYVSYRIQIGSNEMCKDLRSLGYRERKTKSLAISNVPSEYFCHFVRGYFDGDGNVWAGNTHQLRENSVDTIITVFTSCSEKFLTQLKGQCEQFGIRGGCIYTSKHGYYRLQYSVRNSLKLYDFMYNSLCGSKLFLERKKRVFERYKQYRSY